MNSRPTRRNLLRHLPGLAVPAIAAAQGAGNELVVGVLPSLTGSWSTLGEATVAVLELARDEIHTFFAGIGVGTRIRLVVEDTKLDPEIALGKLQILAAQGARVVIGPQSSSEVRRLKAYADANGVLLISQGSTASSLAFPDDNVFRFVPDDRLEAEALVALLVADGVKAIVPVWRADAGNQGLADSTRAIFTVKGGAVVGAVRYGTDTTDFGPFVQAASALVRSAVSQYSAESVAVYLAAFDEAVDLFHVAASDPALSSVRWYGSDGVALSDVLLRDASAAEFARQVSYPNPTLGLSLTAAPRWAPVVAQVRAKLGRDPDAFALAAYDALWVTALATGLTGASASPSTFARALQQVANQFFGATSWTALNSAGDRQYGDFDFWAIRRVDGRLAWVRTTHFENDELTRV
jgi:branched-chain amino acid transport system substrate-binding protein